MPYLFQDVRDAMFLCYTAVCFSHETRRQTYRMGACGFLCFVNTKTFDFHLP